MLTAGGDGRRLPVVMARDGFADEPRFEEVAWGADALGGLDVTRGMARAVILDGRGNILVSHTDATGGDCTVGGGIEPGEAPAEAVAREVREETGHEVAWAQEALVTVETYPDGTFVGWYFLCGLGRQVGRDPTADEELLGEHPVWMGVGEFLASLASWEPSRAAACYGEDGELHEELRHKESLLRHMPGICERELVAVTEVLRILGVA